MRRQMKACRLGTAPVTKFYTIRIQEVSTKAKPVISPGHKNTCSTFWGTALSIRSYTAGIGSIPAIPSCSHATAVRGSKGHKKKIPVTVHLNVHTGQKEELFILIQYSPLYSLNTACISNAEHKSNKIIKITQ